MATTSTPESITLPLVRAIESAWNAIRRNHPDVPAVMITVGSGTEGRKNGMKYGHFAASRWVHGTDGTEFSELFVGGEGMQRGALAVFGTLVHEAAHGVAFVRDVQDVSRGGRYHNKTFKMLAEQMGLTIEQADGIGWSVTTVPDETAKKYARQIAALEKALTVFRRAEIGGGRKGTGRKSNNNGVSLSCGCRKIRCSEAALALGPIHCGACDEEFEVGE